MIETPDDKIEQWYKIIEKEISEVEKDIDEYDYEKNGSCYNYKGLLKAKLSALKSAQAKFDKFVEDLKKNFVEGLYKEWGNEWLGNKHEKMFILMERIIDELSSKQEEKE
jgi:hypothetical protein